ncbi:MAG: hypothetical protein VYE34_09735, partial [Pseudomonadota bacterium]|nr:hypothetical protein [Pseudomonadota bacterium]
DQCDPYSLPEGNKSGSNLAQGSNEFERCEHLSCALALIIGDLSPSSASAHMNYLIKLLWCNFLNFAATGSVT